MEDLELVRILRVLTDASEDRTTDALAAILELHDATDFLTTEAALKRCLDCVEALAVQRYDDKIRELRNGISSRTRDHRVQAQGGI